MNKDPPKDLDMSRLYCKLDQLSSRLASTNSNNVRVNLDVPIQQYSNFCINIRNHSNKHGDKTYQKCEFDNQVENKKVYEIHVNESMNKQKDQVNKKISEGTVPYFTKFSQSQSKFESTPYSKKEQRGSEFTKESTNLMKKSWDNAYLETSEKEIRNVELHTISESKNSQTSRKEHFDSSYDHIIIEQMKSDFEKYQQRNQSNLYQSKQTALQYSNRLQLLNQKLRNSFLKWNQSQNIVIHQQIKQNNKSAITENTKKIQTQTKKVQITPPKKVTTAPIKKSVTPPKKIPVSPPKVTVASPPKKTVVSPPKKTMVSSPKVRQTALDKVEVCSTQCFCRGDRHHRTKRSISPFFNCYEYQHASNHFIYNPSHLSSKQDGSTKKIEPVNCRKVTSSKDINKLITDIRSVYKSRGQITKLNLSSSDSNKKYLTHKLTKKSPNTRKTSTSLVKNKSTSLSPYRGYYHKCLVCKRL